MMQGSSFSPHIKEGLCDKETNLHFRNVFLALAFFFVAPKLQKRHRACLGLSASPSFVPSLLRLLIVRISSSSRSCSCSRSCSFSCPCSCPYSCSFFFFLLILHQIFCSSTCYTNPFLNKQFPCYHRPSTSPLTVLAFIFHEFYE